MLGVWLQMKISLHMMSNPSSLISLGLDSKVRDPFILSPRRMHINRKMMDLNREAMHLRKVGVYGLKDQMSFMCISLNNRLCKHCC
jgi:hypothetical protein